MRLPHLLTPLAAAGLALDTASAAVWLLDFENDPASPAQLPDP